MNLKNRIVMAPMCMDSCEDDGLANDWHFIHYSTRAIGGVGLIIIESTGIEPGGRITDNVNAVKALIHLILFVFP